MNRQKRMRELKSKPWWSYILMLAGVFMFSQACSMISGGKDMKTAIISIFFAILLTTYSSGDLTKRVVLKKYEDEAGPNSVVSESGNMKDKAAALGNGIMFGLMVVIVALCYTMKIGITSIALLCVASVILNFVATGILYKIISKKE